jgi:hypothetical protein
MAQPFALIAAKLPQKRNGNDANSTTLPPRLYKFQWSYSRSTTFVAGRRRLATQLDIHSLFFYLLSLQRMLRSTLSACYPAGRIGAGKEKDPISSDGSQARKGLRSWHC